MMMGQRGLPITLVVGQAPVAHEVLDAKPTVRRQLLPF